MFWTIVWAFVGGLAQWAVSYLAWEVTKRKMTPRQLRWSRVSFIGIALIGSIAIAVVAYRSGRIERAHFSLDLNHKILANDGEAISMDVGFEDVGSGPSINTDTFSRLILEDDESVHSAEEAVSKFAEYKKTRTDIGTDTIPKGGKGYVMPARGPILSGPEIVNIFRGIKTVYLVGAIRFEDDFGWHLHEICKVLEKPVRADGATWGTCGRRDGEKDLWWWER
jgi:hypothetical protein